MKIKGLFLALCALVALSVSAQTPADGLMKAKVMIDGYFFSEMPEHLSENVMMLFLKAPDGERFCAIVHTDGGELTAEEKANALPVEKVEYGAELLREYEKFKDMQPGGKFSNKYMAPLVNVGDKFPAFTATDLNGNVWTNESVKGKVMVLNIWYTGCGPCRKEMPELSEWKNEMPEVMFFSSTHESAELAGPVLEKHGFNWIPLVNKKQFRDFRGSKGFPMTIIVDKEGVVRDVVNGTSPETRDRLLTMIRSLNK